MTAKIPSATRCSLIVALLLLAGCEFNGYPSTDAWKIACAQAGGYPVLSPGVGLICLKKEVLIEVKR